MFTVSKTWPGTCSSGPFDVVGLIKSSPSIIISSGLIPLAVLNAKSPPVNIVSYDLGSGKNAPSEVVFLNTSISPDPVGIFSSSSTIILLAKSSASSYNATPVCPAPVILVILALTFFWLAVP